jgi:molybdopterin-containing oxidoreductase family iron-sulfur binding subunit
VIPACAQACPSKAITFGDIKNAKGAMMRRRSDNPLRAYYALGDLNTQPSIAYLRRIYRSRQEVS